MTSQLFWRKFFCFSSKSVRLISSGLIPMRDSSCSCLSSLLMLLFCQTWSMPYRHLFQRPINEIRLLCSRSKLNKFANDAFCLQFIVYVLDFFVHSQGVTSVFSCFWYGRFLDKKLSVIYSLVGTCPIPPHRGQFGFARLFNGLLNSLDRFIPMRSCYLYWI